MHMLQRDCALTSKPVVDSDAMFFKRCTSRPCLDRPSPTDVRLHQVRFMCRHAKGTGQQVAHCARWSSELASAIHAPSALAPLVLPRVARRLGAASAQRPMRLPQAPSRSQGQVVRSFLGPATCLLATRSPRLRRWLVRRLCPPRVRCNRQRLKLMASMHSSSRVQGRCTPCLIPGHLTRCEAAPPLVECSGSPRLMSTIVRAQCHLADTSLLHVCSVLLC
jgi:hypothetical protein